MQQSANLIQLSDDTFDAAVAGRVVAVQFWASWCMPCRMLEPVVQHLAETFEGQAPIAQIDTDQHRETAKRFDITAVPTIVVLRDGKPVARFVGLTGYEKLASAIETALAPNAERGEAAAS
ncbi:MAG: thioredoxin family protein [Planctomycetota bacterium]